jgi:hypothetical protein
MDSRSLVPDGHNRPTDFWQSNRMNFAVESLALLFLISGGLKVHISDLSLVTVTSVRASVPEICCVLLLIAVTVERFDITNCRTVRQL